MTTARQNPFSILVVCTGNICRSPAAERLLASRLGPTVTVSSAGTHALVDQSIFPPMLALLQAHEVAGDGFSARLLSEPLLRSADLVLAMTRAHRSMAVEMWPAAVRRSFTLREFARLLEQVDRSRLPEGTPAERLRAAIILAAAKRGPGPVRPHDDDVVDPYRRADAFYEASFAQMLPAVEVIAEVAVGREGLSAAGHQPEGYLDT